MKKTVAVLLCALVSIACGKPNSASTPPVDTTPPVLTLNVLGSHIAEDFAWVNVESTEDATIVLDLVRDINTMQSIQMQVMDISPVQGYHTKFSGLKCDTAYLLVLTGWDASGNYSVPVLKDFRTAPCASDPGPKLTDFQVRNCETNIGRGTGCEVVFSFDKEAGVEIDIIGYSYSRPMFDNNFNGTVAAGVSTKKYVYANPGWRQGRVLSWRPDVPEKIEAKFFDIPAVITMGISSWNNGIPVFKWAANENMVSVSLVGGYSMTVLDPGFSGSVTAPSWLMPSMEYTFRIQAKTASGETVLSNPVTFVTEPRVVPSASVELLGVVYPTSMGGTAVYKVVASDLSDCVLKVGGALYYPIPCTPGTHRYPAYNSPEQKGLSFRIGYTRAGRVEESSIVQVALVKPEIRLEPRNVAMNGVTVSWDATRNYDTVTTNCSGPNPADVFSKTETGLSASTVTFTGMVSMHDYFCHVFGVYSSPEGDQVWEASRGYTVIPYWSASDPVSVRADYPTSDMMGNLGYARVATVKVTNNSSSRITVRKMKFTDSGQHSSFRSYLYVLKYSSQNSPDYSVNIASSGNTVDFDSFATYVDIDGGAYRYFSVYLYSHPDPGESFQLSIESPLDVSYSVTEADIGFDTNGGGILNDTIVGLSPLGTVVLGRITQQ